MKVTKAKKYAIEQYLLQNEIIYLLNLHKDGFYLNEVDGNQELIDKIMNLGPQIKKFFCHLNITGLIYPKQCKRPWLSITRGVLKGRYNLKYKACRYPTVCGSIFTMRYFIEPTKETLENSVKTCGPVTLQLTFRKGELAETAKRMNENPKKESLEISEN